MYRMEHLRKKKGLGNFSILFLTQCTVMIFAGKGDILTKPIRRGKGICLFFGREFDFGKEKWDEITGEDIKLDREMISVRDAVAFFCDNAPVCLFAQMAVGFLGKRKIMFFTNHQTFGFVGQDVVISIPADTDNRFGAELPGQTKVAASIMGKDRGTQNAELDRGGCCCTIACAAGQRFSGAALPNSNIGFVFGNRLNKTDVYSTRKCGMVFDEGA